MELPTQTTFIPKKPLVPEYAEESSSFGLLSIISVGLFLLSVLLAGGVYFYKGYISKNVDVQKNSLEISKGRFEPETLEEFKEIDKRLSASKVVLNQHVVTTPIFELLSELTLKNVQYTKFTYKLESPEKPVSIIISGIADSYTTIALQSDNFSKNKSIQDPVFSNLTLDTSGRVLFDLNFNVSSEFVHFVENIKNDIETTQ